MRSLKSRTVGFRRAVETAGLGRGELASCMSAQPSEHDGHDVIRLGGETAVVVPVHEYQTLRALRDRASAEQVEEAEIDATIAEHEAWKAAGRPGLKSHEEFMAEVFGGSR
jgi:hypothetical protein